MRTQFFNRNEAGRLLAENLTSYANRDDVMVLALPRGGVQLMMKFAIFSPRVVDRYPVEA